MSQPKLQGKHVLVVDDESTVREVLTAYLEHDGFVVSQAADGDRALELIERLGPDLIVLDLMLPGADGLSVLTATRRVMSTPVILLTARADEMDRVVGLEMGADDYVVKPFSPREVLARVRAVLKRASEPTAVSSELRYGDLTINGSTREVLLDGQSIELTPREFDLLYFLASAPRQVFNRSQLLDHVWSSSAEWQDPATVTVHIGRLRQKIEDDPADPRWITTVWGVGYKFQP